MTLSGMTLVAVDATGRLSEFWAVPSPLPPDTAAPPPDWSKAFAAAGLPMDQFKAVEPRLVPPFFANERQAWEGPLPERPEHTIRVEAASAFGKPVYFAIAGPWSRAGRLGAPSASLFSQIITSLGSLVIPMLMVVSVILARLNLNADRSDRRGARRLAVVNFVATFTGWTFEASHFATVGVEVNRNFVAMGIALFDTGVVWLTYLGLEPYIRRYRPDTILGSTKLLAGQWRDPRVGVDVMVGVAAGLGMTLLYAAHNVIPVIAGRPEPMPLITVTDPLAGFRFTLAAIANQFSGAITSGLLAAAGVVALVLLLRNTLVAFGVAVVCFTPAVISGMFPGTTPTLDLAIGAGIISILILVVLRAGLLATVAAMFTHFILLRAPITTDVGSWQATTGLWYVGVVLALGLGGCYLARFGHGDRVSST